MFVDDDEARDAVPADAEAHLAGARVFVLVIVRAEQNRARDLRPRVDVRPDADDRVANFAGVQIAPLRDDRAVDAAGVRPRRRQGPGVRVDGAVRAGGSETRAAPRQLDVGVVEGRDGAGRGPGAPV